MREIKFRAWDFTEKENKWFYFTLEQLLTHEINSQLLYFKWKCEYTGLKDKNGKEIYEGDIVKNTHLNADQLVEIYWKGNYTERDSVNGEHWINWGGWAFRKMNDDKILTMAIYDNEIEVIGNIYENKELLNK